MVFHRSLSDSKSPQVSRTLLSIISVLYNAVVSMVSTIPPTSKYFSPFNNPLVTLTNAPITTDIIATFMFRSFLHSLARSMYLSFFSLSFSFILWSACTTKFTILQVLGSIPGRVIPKTLKMVLDTTLLNTQHYKVRFKGKVEQSWEWSSALPYTLV